MGGQNDEKLKKIITEWPRGVVATQSWLQSHGVYRQLARKYLQNSWIERVGHGAYKLAGDPIRWLGGLHALQYQLRLKIHAGARTALELQGYAHFLPIGEEQVVWIFGAPEAKLPAWFKSYRWEVQARFVPTNLFPSHRSLGITEKSLGPYSYRLSTPERAIMEVVALVPTEGDFEEARLLMEGLATLRPALVQELLEQCRSVKTKRLFMYMAEKCRHPWIEKLDTTKINFGKGNRVVVAGGKFDQKYRITVPAETE